MLVTEKQKSTKLTADINGLKISQDKYQKQIYNQGQENNTLLLKNKDLTQQIQLLKVDLEKKQQESEEEGKISQERSAKTLKDCQIMKQEI